jgi:hypothetical protein
VLAFGKSVGRLALISHRYLAPTLDAARNWFEAEEEAEEMVMRV